MVALRRRLRQTRNCPATADPFEHPMPIDEIEMASMKKLGNGVSRSA